MDTTLLNVLKIAGDLGLVALVIYLWWSDKRDLSIVMEKHKAAMAAVLAEYKRDMDEQREMYRANASLCRDYASIAGDLRAIVTLNIQKMTEVCVAVQQNQFCPMVRIQKIRKLSSTDVGNHSEE